MSVSGDFFQFRSGELIPVDVALADNLTVADSFLVLDGTVRAIDKHFERFAGSIESELTKAQLPDFFSQFIDSIPRKGEWFPRIEYRASQPEGERLFSRIRPAPELTETVQLWSLDEPDPREQPQVKGPDLSICQRLRRKANLNGADEAVILSDDGYIADGALSSILWWRGETLCAPDHTTTWLPSVTRSLLLKIATQAGYETKVERAKPADLAGCEIWSVSALQGIRSVVSWGDIPVGMATHKKSFTKRLSLFAEPLPMQTTSFPGAS